MQPAALTSLPSRCYKNYRIQINITASKPYPTHLGTDSLQAVHATGRFNIVAAGSHCTACLKEQPGWGARIVSAAITPIYSIVLGNRLAACPLCLTKDAAAVTAAGSHCTACLKEQPGGGARIVSAAITPIYPSCRVTV